MNTSSNGQPNGSVAASDQQYVANLLGAEIDAVLLQAVDQGWAARGQELPPELELFVVTEAVARLSLVDEEYLEELIDIAMRRHPAVLGNNLLRLMHEQASEGSVV